MQGNDWSSPLLLRKKTVFLKKRDVFLPNDSLTFRCRIRQTSQEKINAERYFATTLIEVEKMSLLGVMKIEYMELTRKKYYVEFIPSSHPPLILMNINVDEEGQFYAELKQANSKLMKFSKCQLSITNYKGEKIAYGGDEFLFHTNTMPLYRDTSKWIFPLTLTLPNTWNQNLSRKMQNLNIQCEILYSIGIVTNKMKKVEYSTDAFQNGCCFKEKRQEYLPSLKDDLLSLMTDAESCDIKLRTVNKVFPAHSIILSARSLFFRNKIDLENMEKFIYLSGLDNETLHEMLVFLYTDSIENLESKNAMKLYIASERYEIPSLKHKCSSFLQNNLDTSICCDVLQIADQYQDSDLKKAAMNYILEHAEVIGSDKWQDLERYTELTAEVLYWKRTNIRKNMQKEDQD